MAAICAFALAVTLSTAAVAAGEDKPSQPPQASAPAGENVGAAVAEGTDEDGDKVVCKREIKTGSRFGRKVCMTVKDWERRREHAKEIGRMIDQKVGLQPTPQGS